MQPFAAKAAVSPPDRFEQKLVSAMAQIAQTVNKGVGRSDGSGNLPVGAVSSRVEDN